MAPVRAIMFKFRTVVAEEKERMNKITSCLEYSSSLPSLPAVALRVIQLAWKPDAEVADLARVIEGDPALAAKLLRIANSPAFRRGGECRNLPDALLVLGFKRAVSFSLTFSLARRRPGEPRGFDQETYWRRTLLAGLSGRALADHLGMTERDDLFLASLLQDIGALALNDLYPEIYREASAANHQSLIEAEREQTGNDHAALGELLLRKWDVPEALCKAVGSSHTPEGAWTPDSPLFDRCVALSGKIADVWTSEDKKSAVTQAAESLQKVLGLEPLAIADVMGIIARQIPGYEEMFEKTLVSANEREALLEQAREASVTVACRM